MSTKLEIELSSTSELMIGDQIIFCWSSRSGWVSWTMNRSIIVMSAPEDQDGTWTRFDTAADDDVTRICTEKRATKTRWRVLRDTHGQLNGPKDFPATCTRCGLAAYVGMFEVTHADEFAAADCPARRK